MMPNKTNSEQCFTARYYIVIGIVFYLITVLSILPQAV